MRVVAVASPPLFTGTAAAPRQIVRVTVDPGPARPGGAAGRAAPIAVRVGGPGVSTPEPFLIETEPGGSRSVAAEASAGREVAAEVGVVIAAPRRPGAVVPVLAVAETPGQRAELAGQITVAEPGWTMWMVSHFHYDPVWWDTQGEFTQTRLLLPDEGGELPETRTAFELVRLHLRAARSDPDYKFVLAEIDYLKPYFDAHPQDRADLRELLARGQVEIVGGSYNEPNTNLTGAESTIRNAVYGIGYQRDVLGGDPATAWMLDAFGHDPAYPGIMAAAGLTSSAWARGPYHQWGPQPASGGNAAMQFPSEFEWISPDGAGLLTSYMANHYGAGWVTHQAVDLATAEAAALEQFTQLAPVAATRNVLLPVGADHVIPSRWVTAIHRDWNARYAWPRFVTGLPREFFTAVRAQAAERGIWLTPQTRDMNPVYPGKDVSYIDTKQAQRAAETAVADGERLATLAWLEGADYPAESLDKAWRLLAFGAHHDAITGTESDQVYLDLLAGWREAFDRGDAARRQAAGRLAALADTRGTPGARPVVVLNTLSWPRAALARITLAFPDAGPGWDWLELRDDAGTSVPFLAQGVRRRADAGLGEVVLTFRADVPALGFRTYWAMPAGAGADSRQRQARQAQAAWRPLPAPEISNGTHAAAADPARGGVLASLVDRRLGIDLLRGPGNELVLQPEYDYHPRWGEGPWLLSPKGPGAGSAGARASVRAERCPIGSRLIAEYALGGLAITAETLLWDGIDRVEFRTHVDGSIGQDALLRARFAVDVPGGLPVYQSAVAVVGRPFGAADADVADHPFTLDNPAHEWFGLGSTARVIADGAAHAVGVAEVIAPDDADAGTRAAVRDLIAALAACGVTATCSRPDGPRYGSLDLDSNLPDVRLSLGGPGDNAWTARLLGRLGPAAAEQTARPGGGPLWIPAAKPRAEVFGPSADVRGEADLPTLIIAGEDLAAAIRSAAADLARGAVIHADAAGDADPDPPLAGRSVALLNRGTPSGLAEPDGALHITLMRASSAWPAGVWIDGDKRTAPDSSSFAWQHWSHTFEYALCSGASDWREAGFAQAGQEYNHDLIAVETPLHEGPLPSRASLAEVATPGSPRPAAMLAALKPRGNPLASGRPATADRAAGMTARLRDLGTALPGSRTVLSLRGGVAAARVTDLLEETDGAPLPVAEGAAEAAVPRAGLITLAISPASPAPPGPIQAVEAAVPPEPVQPVFSRYWLHGKGPAPAGNLPVAVHLSPDRVALSSAGPAAELAREAVLALTVACGPAPAEGAVVLDIPPGLTARLPDGRAVGSLRYRLPPGGHVCWNLVVAAEPGAPAGRRFVAAAIRDGLGQVIEDAVLVTVGEPGPPPLNLPLAELAPLLDADLRAAAAELGLALAPAALALAPGQRGEVSVTITNNTAGPIRGEAVLLAPFGSWDLLGRPARAFSAGPGQTATLAYPVRPPADARTGARWWALAKVACFGRVRHSEAMTLSVAAPDRVTDPAGGSRMGC